MIQVKNINKYFNKNKNNEIHVINDTSLTFPQTGLVCLLGSSGSGKTTLLNVIGGLDKVDNGEIIFDNISIKKYQANKWDVIRNHHFGYIFQNYILLPDLTVYQNLEFVLKMLNVEHAEIESRINYALEAVGMIKYKKRKPNQLSGGQQQRIAIARALVKSPDVVIADEPTGNLDEKNTNQIMNIIKKISKECLVILVTHERRLADFYADQIIEVKDGIVISQNDIQSSGVLHNLDDRNIYLKDLKIEEVESNDISLKYFFDQEKPKLELNIIYKDNTFYINSPTDNVKIKFVNQTSEIKIIDSHKEIINQEQIDKFEYSLPKLKTVFKNKSVIKFKDTVKISVSHLLGLRKRQKLMFLVLLLSAIMVTIGFINYFESSHVDDSSFLTDSKKLLEVTIDKDLEYSEYKKVIKEVNNEITLVKPSSFRLSNFEVDLFQQTNRTIFINTAILPIDVVKKPKLLYGKLPSKLGEIVIDNTIVQQQLTQYEVMGTGIQFPEQFIGLEYYDDNNKGVIVGIVETNNPNCYMTKDEYQLNAIYQIKSKEEIFINYSNTGIDNYFDYKDYQANPEDATLKDLSTIKLGLYEVIIPDTMVDSINIKNGEYVFGNIKFKIVGVYQIRNLKYLIFSDEVVDELLYETLKQNHLKTSIYSNNKKDDLKLLKNLGFKVVDQYQKDYDRQSVMQYNYGMYIVSLIILSSSLLFLYFIMRSSLISRIYEVGVYRALGVKKSNVYKLFFTEVLLITVFTSFLGVLIISLIINKINAQMQVVFYPWYVSILSLLFVFICNVIVGLVPVNRLLRLTPSQILSKYDI
jgi:ABC-type lipoprotein export system ATPase subunit/ABC-type antimicrobial peptide transport system permease subunit